MMRQLMITFRELAVLIGSIMLAVLFGCVFALMSMVCVSILEAWASGQPAPPLLLMIKACGVAGLIAFLFLVPVCLLFALGRYLSEAEARSREAKHKDGWAESAKLSWKAKPDCTEWKHD